MRKFFHRLTLGSILGSLGATIVGAADPSVLDPHTATIVSAVGLGVSLISHLFHANAAEQAIIDTVTGVAGKVGQGGK